MFETGMTYKPRSFKPILLHSQDGKVLVSGTGHIKGIPARSTKDIRLDFDTKIIKNLKGDCYLNIVYQLNKDTSGQRAAIY